MQLGQTATVIVDGEPITGTVIWIRSNGWVTVETPTGHIAGGPVLTGA